MKLFIAALLSVFIFSCSLVRKSSKSEVKREEKVVVAKEDSTVAVRKDSVSVKQQENKNENSIEIEFYPDSAVYDESAFSGGSTADSLYYIIAPIRQKVKKLTVRSSQTANSKDSVHVIDESFLNHSKLDSIAFRREEVKTEESKSRCRLSLAEIAFLVGVAVFLVWAYRKYKSFKIL